MGAERALNASSAKQAPAVPPRRWALLELGALAAALAVPSCNRSPDRRTVLYDLVSDVVQGDVKRLAVEARGLDRTIRAWAAAPSATRETEAREALERTLLVWKRASAFRAGPLAETNVFLRAMFWPIRPSAIDAVLDAERSIDEAVVEQLGANQKGLYALEYLLFARGTQGGFSEQERRFAQEVSRNVLGYAERGFRTFANGHDYAERFAEAGQDSVAKLAELTTDTVEIVFGKLDRVQRRSASGPVGPAEVEGYFSKSSLDVALAFLAGAETLFTGNGTGGLGALVGALSPPVETRVRNEFVSARDALRRLGAPLEESIRTDRTGFEAAAYAIRKLERTLKLEVASALGLSLVFGSADGD